MIDKIIMRKMNEYAPQDAVDQENVLSEILQHYVLAALARAGFFKAAQFQGGTFLRIVHGLDRFSEDMDFVLKEKDPGFVWSKYLAAVDRDLTDEGLKVEIVDRSQLQQTVKKAFVKTGSVVKQIPVDLPFERHPRRKVRIKLEIDTAPPGGSIYETAYIGFPVTSAITVQAPGSAFASKLHALLCRNYVKGRDWFDFLWYANRGIEPNYELLGNAIDQAGPWAGKGVRVTGEWFFENIERRISEVDWPLARQDVERFLPAKSRESAALWTADFFHFHAGKLKRKIL